LSSKKKRDNKGVLLDFNCPFVASVLSGQLIQRKIKLLLKQKVLHQKKKIVEIRGVIIIIRCFFPLICRGKNTGCSSLRDIC
jgi:hypothetical protein